METIVETKSNNHCSVFKEILFHMNSGKYFLLLIVISAAVMLSSCQRVASQAPISTPTPQSDFPFPISTQPNVMKEVLGSTATAMAKAISTSTATAVPPTEEPPPPPPEPIVHEKCKVRQVDDPIAVDIL